MGLQPIDKKTQVQQNTQLTYAPNTRLQTSLQTNRESVAKQGESEGLELPDGLVDIVESWSTLPEHVRQAIVTLVASVTVTAREGDEVV